MPAPYYTLETLQPGSSVGYLLKRCGILMNQVAERRFESQPITFTQWIVLAHLAMHDPHMTPTELSEHLGYDMGALTRIVDDLQAKQLVRRERSEQDRRAVRITATAEGRKLAKSAKSVVLDLANYMVEPNSKAETELLTALLQRILKRMEALVAQPAAEVATGTRQVAGRRRK